MKAHPTRPPWLLGGKATLDYERGCTDGWRAYGVAMSPDGIPVVPLKGTAAFRRGWSDGWDDHEQHVRMKAADILSQDATFS